MKPTLAALVFALFLLPALEADPLTTEKADALVAKLLEKEGARPGGILRVRRYPAVLPKGWTVGEDNDKSKVTLPVEAESYFYYVDRKAGPMYAHAVEYLLVDRATGKTTRKPGEWWPRITDAAKKKQGKDGWWNDPKLVVLGDALPSIQDGQRAVKFKWMMAKMPAGMNSMTMYSCPATVPKGGTVWVGEGDEAKQVHKAAGATFLMTVDYQRGKAFPRPLIVLCWDRTTKKTTKLWVTSPPWIKDAKERKITTEDGGTKLGKWWEESAHSFMSKMVIGGR